MAASDGGATVQLQAHGPFAEKGGRHGFQGGRHGQRNFRLAKYVAFEVNARPALDLPIPLMEGAVKITPESVSIRGRVETLEVTETKGPIAIKWSIPDVVQRDFAVMAESGEFFVHIEVKGPLDRVSRLDKSDIRALVEVYARDLDSPGPGKTILREVRFLLPNEFCDCKLVSPIQQIGFRLEPRAAGATRENSSSTSG